MTKLKGLDYNGTSKCGHFRDQQEVSRLERCPHFRDELIHDPIALGLNKGVLNMEVFAFHGSPHLGVPLYGHFYVLWALQHPYFFMLPGST